MFVDYLIVLDEGRNLWFCGYFGYLFHVVLHNELFLNLFCIIILFIEVVLGVPGHQPQHVDFDELLLTRTFLSRCHYLSPFLLYWEFMLAFDV